MKNQSKRGPKISPLAIAGTSILIGMIAGVQASSDAGGPEPVSDKHPYMGGAVELMTAPNGAIVNSYTLERAMAGNPKGPHVIEVAEGIWQFAGMSISWPTVIEGETGLILYDTGENLEEGELFLKILRQFSDKPVKAIIYSHAHYTKGAQALAEGSEDVQIIAHHSLEANLVRGGGLGAAFPELTPVLMARTIEQFNAYTPREGEDAALGGIINIRPGGHLSVTSPVRDGETLIVDGIEMQFLTEFHSDTDDCLMVWMPDRKIILNNLYIPVLPNFYTPRGSLYRDPFNWIAGIERMRDLEPELMLSSHTGPVYGADEIRNNLILYRDGLSFVIDQTLRGILQGLGPDELRHFVKMPSHLAAFQNLSEIYGELQWYPPYFYEHALGWWDRDAANLFKLAPQDEALRLVRLMGGSVKVLEAASEAIEANEFAWAAQLANYVLKLDQKDPAAKTVKADALRAMGHRARGSIARAFYLSQALALEGKVEIASVIPPMPDMVAITDPREYLRRFRVRIDPVASRDMDTLLQVNFIDLDGVSAGLHLRQGVVEYVEDMGVYYREPDLVLGINRAEWMKLYVMPSAAQSILSRSEEETHSINDRTDIVEFLALFDDLG